MYSTYKQSLMQRLMAEIESDLSAIEQTHQVFDGSWARTPKIDRVDCTMVSGD